MNEKVKIEIPVELIHVIINAQNVDFDEAFDLVIKGASKLIKAEVRVEYNNYLKGIEENDRQNV